MGRLSAGEKRYISNVADPAPGRPPKRLCVQNELKQRRYECPQQVVQGSRQHPVLHCFTDLGPIGFVGASALIHGLGLRATISWDLLHRRVCDLDLGLDVAGLRGVQLEMRTIMRLRQGPFNLGGGYHAALRLSAQDMFEVLGLNDNIMFEMLEHDIGRDMGMARHDIATEYGRMNIYTSTQEFLVKDTKGDDTKASRWFKFNENSRGFSCAQHDTIELDMVGIQDEVAVDRQRVPLASLRLKRVPRSAAGRC